MTAIGLGLLIFIHELGHYLACRVTGTRVEAFSIGFGPTLIAVLWLSCLAAVLGPHIGRVWRAVVPAAAKRAHPAALVALGILLIGAFAFTWWTANHNNRAPTAVDGVWAPVTEAPPEGHPLELVFFERNRAHLAVFRYRERDDVWRRFEISGGGAVRIWTGWRAPGELLLEGRFEADGTLTLAADESGEAMIFRKVGAPGAAPASYLR